MSVPAILESQAVPAELNLREALEVIRRRKAVFVEVFAAVLSLGIVATALTKPVYQTHAKLLVPSVITSVNVVDTSNPIATMLAAAQPDSVSTQMQTLESDAFLEEAERRAGVKQRPEVVPPSVKVDSQEGTNIIEVTVAGGDPQEIKRLANQIVDLHVERNDLLTTTGLKNTLEFVRKENDKAGARLAAAEQKLLQFRQAHRLVGLPAEREARTGEYAALLARVIELESNISSTRSQITNLRARLQKEPPELVQVTTKDNPRIGKLRDKLDELNFLRTDLLRDYRPTSRQVQDLDQQMERLQEQLASTPPEMQTRTHTPNPNLALMQTRLQDLQASLQAYEDNHAAAAAQYQAKKGILDTLAPAEQELDRLTHDREAAQATASMLSDRLRDLQMRCDARLPTVRAIERPTLPSRPIRPNKPQGILLAGFLALLLAAATVYLQDYLDDRVNAPDEIERLYGLPTLANVPQMPHDQPRLVAALPLHSPMAEAYRSLRAGIGFAATGAPIRCIQVTSSTKGEGKSTTSVNLATAMARDGKTVVLVDADMRAPSVHRLLNIAPSPGLSEVLAGMKSVGEALRTMDVPNLMVLPAGAIPPNPAELLGSPAFDPALEQLREHADVVIFDTPPCLPITDPLIVAARMDAVVLVMQAGQTRKGSIKQTVELLGRAHARILGILFNQVQPHGSGSYYYYQYSSYGEDNPSSGSSRGRRHRRNGHEPKPELGSWEPVATASRPGDAGEE
jgi:capsular exopolysaccharide synthesis family protein